jgi:hypothetical protein
VWTQAYEPGVGQRGGVAELGMVQGGEIVHRDHLGRPPCRRHDEIRPVHDVDAADEPFDRWPSPALPHGMKRTGRHRALGRGHPGGQVGADPLAATPTDGEGPHVEVVALPQRAQGAEAEDADTRGRPQQRCGVESHLEAGRHAAATHQLDALGTGGALHMAQAVIAPSTERIDPVA